MSEKTENKQDNITPISPTPPIEEPKESNTQKTSKGNGGNGKSNSKNTVLIFFAIIAFIAMACGFFYANDRSKKDVGEVKQPQTTTTEVKKEVSLEKESIEAQRVLDNILLKKNNWQLREEEHGLKEVSMPDLNSKVKINQRELNVGVPNTTSLSAAGDWLKEKVEEQGLVYLGGEECNYRRWDGFRSRIGIKTKAGNGNKNFLTDTIVFFHNSNLIREDKDVKEKKVQAVSNRKFKGKVAILIDDCGQDNVALKTLLDTNLPFSYAILPNKKGSTEALSMIKSKGRVAMLHLPMEAQGNAKEEDVTVYNVDGPKVQAEKTRKLLASLPGVIGVNNHQGSAATSDKYTMEAVLKELKKSGMFFIDSRTTSKSVARDVARSLSVSTARNDIFLDNEADVEKIRIKIYEAFAHAERNGSAIAICHSRTKTAECWQKYAAEFKACGIEFVPVTSLLY